MQFFAHVGGALLGLIVFSLLAPTVGLLEPPWWGGKGLLYPVIGSIYVLVFSVPSYSSLRRIMEKSAVANRSWRLGVAGFFHGAIGLYVALAFTLWCDGRFNPSLENGIFVLLAGAFVVVIGVTNPFFAVLGKRNGQMPA